LAGNEGSFYQKNMIEKQPILFSFAENRSRQTTSKNFDCKMKLSLLYLNDLNIQNIYFYPMKYDG
jgi:uncharacterized membrane protein (UPF0127 family)